MEPIIYIPIDTSKSLGQRETFAIGGQVSMELLSDLYSQTLKTKIFIEDINLVIQRSSRNLQKSCHLAAVNIFLKVSIKIANYPLKKKLVSRQKETMLIIQK
jgi:hypothetical protein